MIIRIFIFLLLLSNGLTDEEAETVEETAPQSKVRYLDPGTTIHYTPFQRRHGFFDNEMRIYCYQGNPKILTRMFESIEFQIDIENDDYMQYEGETPEEVHKHYDERKSLFSFSLFSQKRSRLQLSPFRQQCIGIETLQKYRVHLEQLPVDFWRVMQAAMGICVFVYAAKLSQNSIFYYITGVLLGICFSFLLLIWLCSKLLPKKTMVYGTLVGGWAIGLYLIQLIWQNLQTLILTYKSYVLWYLLSTGIISFFFCYRWGPPKDQRSRNIIKWSLQIVALLLIYISTQFEEAGIAVAIITAIIYYFPMSVFRKLRRAYLRIFPPKRRFLANEEYYEEGVRETTKALDELRAYASSPECNQWKVMTKLSNPHRFAAFVEGASHLKDDEILSFEGYNDDPVNDSETNDDSEDENTNYSNNRYQKNSLHSRRNLNYEDNAEISEDDFVNNYSNRFAEKRKISNSFNARVSQQRNGLSSPNYPDSSNNSLSRKRTPTRSAFLIEKARETGRTPPLRRSTSRYNNNSNFDEDND